MAKQKYKQIISHVRYMLKHKYDVHTIEDAHRWIYGFVLCLYIINNIIVGAVIVIFLLFHVILINLHIKVGNSNMKFHIYRVCVLSSVYNLFLSI